MGWRAWYKEDLQLVEEGRPEGRPMQDGQDGKLLAIAQEDYGHKVALDLTRGTFLIDYDDIREDHGTLIATGDHITYLSISDETNIGGDLFHLDKTEPDEEGNYFQTIRPLEWRPIWFTRHIHGPVGPIEVKCIGAQTTLPEENNGKNLKAFISLFPDGRVGVTDGAYAFGGDISG